jgi:hypothetical protein
MNDAICWKGAGQAGHRWGCAEASLPRACCTGDRVDHACKRRVELWKTIGLVALQVGPEDSGSIRDDVAVGPCSTQPASDRCGGHPDLFGDLPVSQPLSGGGEGRPDGLDAVGASRERPDWDEHVGAIALTAACASWGHRVGATTEKPHRSGSCGAPGLEESRAVRRWAGLDAIRDAGGGGFGIEHEQQRRAFLECGRRDGRRGGRVRVEA